MTNLNRRYVLTQLIKDPMFMWMWIKKRKDGSRPEDYTFSFDTHVAIIWPEDWEFKQPEKDDRLAIECKVDALYQGPDAIFKGVVLTDRKRENVIQAVVSNPNGSLIRYDDALTIVWTLSV